MKVLNVESSEVYNKNVVDISEPCDHVKNFRYQMLARTVHGRFPMAKSKHFLKKQVFISEGVEVGTAC